MAQLAIYIDDRLAERLDRAVRESGKSKSKWVAEAIKHSLHDQWPDGFFELARSWEDDNEADLGEGNLMLLREGVTEMEEAIRKMRKKRACMSS